MAMTSGLRQRFARTLLANAALGRAAPMVGRAAMGTVIALLIAVAGQRWGEYLLRWLLPTMQARLQDLLPEFHIAFFALTDIAGEAQLRVEAVLMRPLQIGRHVVDQLVLANASVTLGAFWQPVAAATATAAVWPSPAQRKVSVCGSQLHASPKHCSTASFLAARMLALCSAFLAAAALSALLAPSVLAGLIVGDIYWHEASEQIVPHIVRLPRFLEEGGWLVLGLAIGSLCAITAQWPLTWHK